MTRTSQALLTLLFLAALVQASMAATPPDLISYQGVLRDAAGSPLDGIYDMTFRFAAEPTGGTLLLTDYHTGPDAVAVSGGLFTVLLGGGTLSPGTESSLQSIFANYAPVYVEVQVGAETLAPRVQIVSTGYALNAGLLGGRVPGNYLDTSSSAQLKAGSLKSLTGLVADSSAPTGDVRAVNATTISSAGIGVLGTALAPIGTTEGVRGQSTSPDGRGVVGGAFATYGASVGVYGESQSPDGSGVEGVATALTGGTVGVGGENFSTLGTGVAGVARATSGEAWGVYGETASPTGYGVVSVGDSITAGDIYATGTKFFLTEHPTDFDSAIRFACLEGGEVGVYQRGGGRLEGGEARIEFPDPFPLVATGNITVQVTPEEESGALYVPRDGVGPEGFTVRESGGTGSNTAFTYLAMAERTGYVGAEAVRPISISDKIVTTPRLTPGQKAALRAALPAGSGRSIEGEERADLYSALHEGDFSDSCRLLGGCGTMAGTPVGLGPQRSAQDWRQVVEPMIGEAPDEPTSASKRNVAASSIDPSRKEETYPPATLTSENPPSALASWHVVSDGVESGDVVVVDRAGGGAMRPGRDAYDRGVVGVVAFVDGTISPGETTPVAVAGVVPCRVDADYGWIEPGDLLVVSPTPGHAMRAYDPVPGTILGKALEPLEAGRGTIMILLLPR